MHNTGTKRNTSTIGLSHRLDQTAHVGHMWNTCHNLYTTTTGLSQGYHAHPQPTTLILIPSAVHMGKIDAQLGELAPALC